MKKWLIVVAVVVILAVGMLIFNYVGFPDQQLNKSIHQEVEESKMELESPVFEDGVIPAKYTCDGENVNPELSIGDIPEEAETLALVVDDPDAPKEEPFVHWVVFNIDPGTTKIEENSVPNGVEGKNDFGDIGYGGPCPPSGTHRYHFKLYALDTSLDLQEGASKQELLNAMKDHVIEGFDLIEKYSRG